MNLSVGIKPATVMQLNGFYRFNKLQWGSYLHSPTLKNPAHFRIRGITDNRRHSWLENPGFLGRNFSRRGPEQTGMVERNIGNYANQRRYYISGIETTTKSNLYNSNIYFFGRKPAESHSGSKFEK